MEARVVGRSSRYRLVPARPDHAADIARIHATCIVEGFLSSLGQTFLRQLYLAMMQHDGTQVFAVLDGDRVVAFSSVTQDTPRMYRWIMRRRLFRIGWPLVRQLFRWTRLKRMLETLFYPAHEQVRSLPRAELLSFAVAPEARRQGLGVVLCQCRVDWLAGRGVTEAKVAATEGLHSNEIYPRLGFTRVDVKDHHGRPLNLYTIRITPMNGKPIAPN